eukprot:scaffold235208_cov34-Prasinocladus_malaysianus.AAC.1
MWYGMNWKHGQGTAHITRLHMQPAAVPQAPAVPRIAFDSVASPQEASEKLPLINPGAEKAAQQQTAGARSPPIAESLGCGSRIGSTLATLFQSCGMPQVLDSNKSLPARHCLADHYYIVFCPQSNYLLKTNVFVSSCSERWLLEPSNR